MKNEFFFTVVLNTDSTLYLIKISKKFKILNMPKMAKNGPKWPKFGPNTCKFDIFKLEMSQNYVESHTDCPETIFQKSKIFDMPKMAKNSYFGHKKLRLNLLAKIRAKRTSPSFSEAFLLSVCKKSAKKYQKIRCKGLILAILGHFGAFWACQKFLILE